MRAILGLVRADSGEISFNGRLKTFLDNSLIGYMPEERGLYAKSKVSDQLRYFGELHGLSKQKSYARVDELLERFEVGHFSNRALFTLSLGNQQRIQLIAALVHGPQLLILDEPFNGLDPVAMSQLITILRELTEQGVAVLFSSHQLDLVSNLCDRVVIIDSGKVIAEDSLSNLQIRDEIKYLIVGDNFPQNLESKFPLVLRYLSSTEIIATFSRNSFLNERDLLLKTILKSGSLEAFTEIKPPLSEIYRDLLTYG
jgi:ABC-2 type transport system ATP-binding protein